MFKHLRQTLLTCSVACLLTLSVSAKEAHEHQHEHEHDHQHEHAQGPRQHGAHVHGTAQLTVAQDGSQVLLELESPAANIFGFEHAPGNAQQRTSVRDALAALRKGESLFTFPGRAGCVFQEADIDAPFTADSPSEHAHDPSQAAHSDILAAYAFECAHPERLDRVQLGLFSTFPRLEQLKVQFIMAGRQGAVTLDAAQPVLAF